MGPDFYDRPVVLVARDLVGCVLAHAGTSGVIVETEAYHQSEPAAHSFGGRTERNRIIYGPPGRAYVYRSYGIHALFNVSAMADGIGAGVLVRALEPVEGVGAMRERRGGIERDVDLCNGPGKLTQALDIELKDNDQDLAAGPIAITPRPPEWQHLALVSGPRIGITRAMDLPWRFCARGSRNVSKPWPPGLMDGAGAGR